MIFLTGMDEENQPLSMIDFSLSDAAGEAMEPFCAVAQTKNCRLELQVEPNISYHDDEGTIRQLVSLLVDNTVKYYSPQGEIRVDMQMADRNKILTV